ncbi:MAG: DUF721 domain-containing protein [Proteobacteria bacterium]|nr:DUF721 domain-containing protein [Pseudomonadota bacterium]
MPGQKNLKTRNLIARQFNELVSSNDQLNKLYHHAKDICTLNEKLHKHLAPSLRSHCNVANYSDETLTVNADTSAWASKLRYCIPDILEFAKLECGLTNLKTVRVRVSPIHHKANQSKTVQSKFSGTNPTRKAHLSKESADFMKNIAESINDPALRKSILKISTHGK